jgi:hypothetical protein
VTSRRSFSLGGPPPLASAGAVASGIVHRDVSAAVVPPALFEATVPAALLVNTHKAVAEGVPVAVAALSLHRVRHTLAVP